MNLIWPPTPMQKLGAAAVGVFLVIILIWAWISSGQRQARDLAVAEERDRNTKVLEEENRKREAERQIEREQTAKLIEANAELQANLARSMAARDQAVNRTIAQLRAPRTTEQIIKDSIQHLGITPQVIDNSIRLTPEQFQDLIAIKVDRDRLKQNLEDQERQLRLERDTTARLTTQIAGFEATLKESNQLIVAQREVIESYKKVAKKGKLRKVLEVGGQVGLGIGLGYLGALAR